MALDRAIRNEGTTGSVYDERGIISFDKQEAEYGITGIIWFKGSKGQTDK